MQDISKIIGDYEELIDLALQNLADAEIDIAGRQIDHIAYRARTKEEFNQIRTALLNGYGEIISENLVRNRPIPIFKLKEPIRYKEFTIDCLELMAPAEGDRTYQRSLEHLEIVITEIPLLEFASKYPKIEFITSNLKNLDNPELIIVFPNDANVKFHPKSIEDVVTKK